eukprot:897954-Rhodomonas_salina.1
MLGEMFTVHFSVVPPAALPKRSRDWMKNVAEDNITAPNASSAMELGACTKSGDIVSVVPRPTDCVPYFTTTLYVPDLVMNKVNALLFKVAPASTSGRVMADAEIAKVRF